MLPRGGRPAGLRTGLWCSDVDLWQREITIRGKDRIVRIGHQAARSLDRYLRPPPARTGLAAAAVARSREPLTAAGIYQMITRRGRQCGVDL